MKNCLRITFAYLAAVIGAGFASGSEIVNYFLIHGKISFAGIVLSSAGFGFFAYALLYICIKTQCFSFYELTKKIMPEAVYKITNIILLIFMFILLGAMISAFSYMLYEHTGINKAAGAFLFSALCFIILINNREKIITISGILGIFIVFFICLICLYLINFRCITVFNSHPLKMTGKALVYTSYNTFAAAPLLCSMAKDLKTKNECRTTGIISGILCFFSLSLIWCLVSVYYGKIHLGEMPMLTIAMRHGTGFAIFYSFIIFISVLTSAVSNGFGIMCAAEDLKIHKVLKLTLVLFSAGFIASFGFETIINKMYAAAGLASIIFPIYIFLKFANKVDKR